MFRIQLAWYEDLNYKERGQKFLGKNLYRSKHPLDKIIAQYAKDRISQNIIISCPVVNPLLGTLKQQSNGVNGPFIIQQYGDW